MNIERWFQGTIVDINDPLKMGRVKVKELIGHNKEMPEENSDPTTLLWCHVIMPPTGANAKGIGISAIGLNKDSKILGFRVNSNLSYVIGSLPFAVDDNNHSISRHARGLGPVQKNYAIELGEKETKYAAEYPHNKTITTSGGHVIELDDTPKSERIHVYHKSGSYVEIFPDGSIVTKSVKDSVSVTMNDHSISVIKGDLQIVANEGKIQINADGDIDLVSKTGVVNIQATEVGITGNLFIDGDVDIKGKLVSDTQLESNQITLTRHKHDPITGNPIP